jgi:hypothetical protein
MQYTKTHDWRAHGAQEPHASAQFPAVIEGELCEGAPYTSAELASEIAIAESTLRTRWLPWLERVAPVELLKTTEGYTDLARSLALEFKQVPSKKAAREKWAAEAKQRYSREFSPDGLVGPGVCVELGSALALVKQQGSQIQLSATAGFEQLKDLISQQGRVQADFDSAEVAALRARGLNRGVQRFQIEAEAEDSAYFELRRLRSQAGSSTPEGT